MSAQTFESSIPTRAQLAAWAPSEAAIFNAVQAEADERDRGLDMLRRGRGRRRPEPMPWEDR